MKRCTLKVQRLHRAQLKGADIHKALINKQPTTPHSMSSKQSTCIILNTAPAKHKFNRPTTQTIKRHATLPYSSYASFITDAGFNASATVQQASEFNHLQPRDLARSGSGTDAAHSSTGLSDSCSSALLASKTVTASLRASADFG